jgi:hypothetical protein
MEKRSSDNINLGSNSALRMEFLNKLFEIADNDVIFGICFATNANIMYFVGKFALLIGNQLTIGAAAVTDSIGVQYVSLHLNSK